MRRRTMLVCALAVVAACGWAFGGEAEKEAPKRSIDLAICLDTSGSMTGLINAARQKLWDIVNELALAKPQPVLRVALLTYGSPGDANAGYIVKQTGLTNDLDTVYQKLMALGTNGGDEYVGWVVHTAMTDLEWNTAKDALKIIFVAGNEPADQAKEKFDYRKVCPEAIAKDIIVNSIYCGQATSSEVPGWQEVAKLADGNFAVIDQNNGTVSITTPLDTKIAELGAKLNTTYVPYGKAGSEGAANQQAQDANSATVGASNLASRALSKAQTFYTNAAWDLLDARKQKDFDLAKVKKDDLPEVMQKMNLDEQNAYLDKMDADRAAIQKEINELGTQRREYIAAETKKNAAAGKSSLDAAMLDSIREQAAEKNFEFSESFGDGK